MYISSTIITEKDVCWQIFRIYRSGTATQHLAAHEMPIRYSEHLKPVHTISIMAHKRTTFLRIQAFNNLQALSNTFLRPDLALERRIFGPELLQHKLICLCYL